MDQRCQKTGAVLEREQTAAAGATRVRYRERQLLRAADLAAEQSYHLAARRRHNTGLHGWGIVRGLRLIETPAGFGVEPGMALDGYGRELFIGEPLVIQEESFDLLESDELDVWLVYDRVEETTALRGRWDCGPGRHNRWREVSRLRLTPAHQPANPRAPVEVPLDDIPFAPHRTPPDDPAREWPVYLGTISNRQTFAPVERLPRPYVKLAGEFVNAPSGRARMQVGSELVSQSERFAVAVPDATGAFIKRLSIDREGKTAIRGDANLGGNLTMHESEAGTSTENEVVNYCSRAPTRTSEEAAARAIIFRPPASTPDKAAPWQLYRTTITEAEKQVRQLRFELGHPGGDGDPALNKFVVGTSDAAGSFTACLTLTADCLLTIAGDLNVNGRLIEGPIKADPTDPRFGAALINQWSKGVVSANSQLGDIFGGGGGNELTALVESQDAVSPRAVLNYEIQVTNNGPSALTSVQLYVNLVYRAGDTVLDNERKTFGAYTLSPGEQKELPALTYNVGPTEGTIVIEVTAIGVGPLSNVLSVKSLKTIQVSEPIP